MPQKTEKVTERAPSGTPTKAPKNRLKTDPEIHLGPHGPIIWPKVPRHLPFCAPEITFYRFGHHSASFLKALCNHKAAKQASGKAVNLYSILHISSVSTQPNNPSSRLPLNQSTSLYFFPRVGGSASHINIYIYIYIQIYM